MIFSLCNFHFYTSAITRILAGENREKEDAAALAVITIFVIFKGVTAEPQAKLAPTTRIPAQDSELHVLSRQEPPPVQWHAADLAKQEIQV